MTELTDDDRAAIRARAEAATPGPWHICDEPDVFGDEQDWPEAVVCDAEHQPVCTIDADWYEKDSGEPTPAIDAAHIASMDPVTTLALLNDRDNLAAEVERLRALMAESQQVENDAAGLCQHGWAPERCPHLCKPPRYVPVGHGCPHAAPFVYCDGCKASPCPIELDGGRAAIEEASR